MKEARLRQPWTSLPWRNLWPQPNRSHHGRPCSFASVAYPSMTSITPKSATTERGPCMFSVFRSAMAST